MLLDFNVSVGLSWDYIEQNEKKRESKRKVDFNDLLHLSNLTPSGYIVYVSFFNVLSIYFIHF